MLIIFWINHVDYFLMLIIFYTPLFSIAFIYKLPSQVDILVELLYSDTLQSVNVNPGHGVNDLGNPWYGVQARQV